MRNDPSGWLATPRVGQQFTDDAGQHWQVRTVIRSPGADGYYIVRVSFGSTPECVDGVSVLGRGEFRRLCRENNLSAVPPGPALTPSCAAGDPAGAPDHPVARKCE